MVPKLKIIITPVIIVLISFFYSCEDSNVKNEKPVSQVVVKKISQPPAPLPLKKNENTKKLNENNTISNTKSKEDENNAETEQKLEVKQVAEHYESKGKIDPFRPLFQEKTDTPPPPDTGPVRILTPLEKIELSQIRLVAVISMKDRRIAMVEEASGKGYEVSVGTYIGKQRGRIAQINDSSIVIREPVRDFKGRLSERVREIKLQKTDI